MTAIVSVRLDRETDNLLSELAKKKGVKKSDMIRILIIKGLEMDPESNEIFDEILESTLSMNSLVIKNFKATAQILAYMLSMVDGKKAEAAREVARGYLAKHGVLE